MAINWGREAGAFADGLVKGSEAVSKFNYYTAEAEHRREQAATERQKNPYNNPAFQEAMRRANARGAPQPVQSTQLPPSTSMTNPGGGVLPVTSLGSIPYDKAGVGFAEGGEVPGTAGGKTAEQAQFDEEFRRLFNVVNSQQPNDDLRARASGLAPAPVLRDAPPPKPAEPSPLERASNRGYSTDRNFGLPVPRADVRVREIDDTPAPPDAGLDASTRGLTPQPDRRTPPPGAAAPAPSPLERASGRGYGGSAPMPRLDPEQQDAPPLSLPQPVQRAPAEPPAPPTEGVLPGAAAAGVANRPGGANRPAAATTVASIWPRIKEALAGVMPSGNAAERAAAAPAPAPPTSGVVPDAPRPPEEGQLRPGMTTTESARRNREETRAQIEAGATAPAQPERTVPDIPTSSATPPEPEPAPTAPAPTTPAPTTPAPAPAPTPAPAPAPAGGGGAPAARAPARPPAAAPAAAPAPAPAYDPNITMTRGRSTAVVGGKSDDLEGMLNAALNGAMRQASRKYYIDESGQVVPDITPVDRQAGKQALLAGNEAATPQAVAAIDRKLQRAAGSSPYNEAMKSTMRMLALYDFYASSGQTAKADQMALELVQYSAMVASMYGKEALDEARRGNIGGAAQLVAKAYNAVPNGKSVQIVNGKAVVTDQFSGKVDQEITLDPRLILTLARGFEDKGATFMLLSQRAQRVAEKGMKQTPLQQEHMRAQIDLIRQRIEKLKSGGGGGTPAANQEEIRNLIKLYPAAARPAENAPVRSMSYVGRGDDGEATDAMLLSSGSGSSNTTTDTTDDVAGAASGGAAPALTAQAPTTSWKDQIVAGSEGQQALTGGDGSDTLSDAAPEPLVEGQQLAQVTPGSTPSAAGAGRAAREGAAPVIPTPPAAPPARAGTGRAAREATAPPSPEAGGNRRVREGELPEFNPAVDPYDERRASGLPPHIAKKKPAVDPRDGTLLIGPKHPEYKEVTDKARVAGVSVLPNPNNPAREGVRYHNEPSMPGVQFARTPNGFKPVVQNQDVLSETERADYARLEDAQAHYLAMGKPGKELARVARDGLKAWDKQIEHRDKARIDALKADTKAALINKFGEERATKFEADVQTALTDPTIKRHLQTFTDPKTPGVNNTFTTSEIYDLTKRIAQLNPMSARGALEVLGVLARGGGDKLARAYQVLGTTIDGDGIVLEAPTIRGNNGDKDTSYGFAGPIVLDIDTFKAINHAAGVNTLKNIEAGKPVPSIWGIGQKVKEIYNRNPKAFDNFRALAP